MNSHSFANYLQSYILLAGLINKMQTGRIIKDGNNYGQWPLESKTLFEISEIISWYPAINHNFVCCLVLNIMAFSFYLKKNAILCFFLKNVSPSKRVLCFILNNSHMPMVEGVAFCAPYKSRILIILYKAVNFWLFIEPPDEI